MNRHKCILRNIETNTNISKEDKDKIKDKCVLMYAKDLRPFNFVEGKGFKELAQELINTGTKYDTVDVASVLSHSKIVSRHSEQMVD